MPRACSWRNLCIFSSFSQCIKTLDVTTVGAYTYTEHLIHLPSPPVEVLGIIVQVLEWKARGHCVPVLSLAKKIASTYVKDGLRVESKVPITMMSYNFI